MSKRTLTFLIIILLLGGAFTIWRIFFTWTIYVPSGAMSNTIIPGDYVLVTRSFGEIERGQIVVFQFPEDSTFYLKRVVGLPGEAIQLRGRTVYINERPLAEQKVQAIEYAEGKPLQPISTKGKGAYQVFYTRTDEERAADGTQFGTREPFRIPNDSYFVLGDNRDNSEDSRYRGPVPRNLIWGSASLIYFSATQGEVRSERVLKRIH